MIKFLRIFSHVTAFPALLAFFYIIIKSLDREASGYSGAFPFVIAFIILLFPMAFNRAAWLLDKRRGVKK
ncbi:MAG: hypothetical protein BMS9Abin23_0168 [Thermodesulfobacteriota bacterium]|nr:MAG: hypothetical protein BMS9Abin23_0168 [Thermodesulfobacteriota bacterium]